MTPHLKQQKCALMLARAFVIGVVFVLAITPVALAQQKEDVITHADTLVAGQVNGQPVEQLINNMRFVQGSLYGSADKAIKYTNGHKLELIGHVEIHQDTLSLYAPHVIYNDSTRIGHADGNVRLFDRDIELTAADGDYDMDRQVANFHHHVTITQGKSTSLSDDLIYYRSTKTSILTGHAEVRSDSGSLTADTIVHVQALDETTAKGNVHLTNDSLRLASDWFFYSKALGEMYARGHVEVDDIQNQTTVFGDTLARFSNTHFMIVPKRPLLLYLDSSQVRDSTGKMETVFDTMFLRADTMKMFQGDSARFIAIDSVRMMKDGFSLTGGKLIYDQANDVMTVFHAKRQHIWNDSTEIDADSVAMMMKDRHVNRIFAVGHAFATSPVDELPNTGRIDQMEGESMMMIIEHDTAKRLYDMQSALSIYFLVSNGKPSGVNRSSGDTIRMDFKNKAVIRLAVISGTEGEYFPERFVGERAAAFRLNDYERHTSWRPLREEFVVPWAASLITPGVTPSSQTETAPVIPPTTPSKEPTKDEHKGTKRKPAS